MAIVSAAGERKGLAGGYVFGAPVGDLGWFASLIIGVATGMAAFFIAEFVAIMSVLFYNAAGHHVDFALTYRRVGFPVGVGVMVLALGYLGMLWVRRKSRQG